MKTWKTNSITCIIQHISKAILPKGSFSTETNPKFAMIAPKSQTVNILSLQIRMDDRGGRIAIVLP